MIAFPLGVLRAFAPRSLAPILSLFALIGVYAPIASNAALPPTPEDYEVIYDNTTTYTDWAFTSATEWGDEVILAGHARRVVEFSFEYFGDFTPSGDEFGIIRFYKNDGFPWPPASFMPGTLIWESAPFKLEQGIAVKTLRDIERVVPANFTWTIQVTGLTGVAGDAISTLVYDPPTVGKSFKDIWIKEREGVWKLAVDRLKRRMSFSAKVTAERESPTIVATSLVNGKFLTRGKAKLWRKYQLQGATDLKVKDWQNIGAPVLASSGQVEFQHDPDGSARFFRILELPGAPEVPQPQITSVAAQGAKVNVTASLAEGYTYQLQTRTNETSEWQAIGKPVTAVASTAVFVDASEGASISRQYRLAQVNELESFVSPEALSFPLTNGLVQVKGTNVVDGQFYQVEYSTNLLGAEWKPIGGPIRSVNSTVTVNDKPFNALPRTYRLRHLHAPKILQLIPDEFRMTVVATAKIDHKYALEYSNSLTNQTWYRASASVVAEGPAVVLKDNAISRTSRYYRVVPVNP